MKPTKININTKTKKYSIIIGSNLGLNISKIISESLINFNQCLLVVDKNVPKKNVIKIKKSLYKKKTLYSLF